MAHHPASASKTSSVTLYIRIRTPAGASRFVEPIWSANEKLKPFYARVGGAPQHHPEGSYYLRYKSGGKRRMEPAGNDPQLAVTARNRREIQLRAKATGLTIAEPLPLVEMGPRRNLDEAISEYLAEVHSHKAVKTWLSYSAALRDFRISRSEPRLRGSARAAVECIEDIARKDILEYMTFMRKRGVGPRTVANRISYLKSFLLRFEVRWPLLKSDKARYTDKEVSAYSQAEMRSLLAAADQEESDLIQFLVFTGAREKEVKYACWTDIGFEAQTFSIREKLDMRFTPKDLEEGSIPIPDVAVKMLRERRDRSPKSRLIFPGPNGLPNGHLLRTVKNLAFRAGLNCGHCHTRAGSCCADGPVCSRFILHRFRKTFATMHHEAGIPARKIQSWLRHSSLDTTLRYLAASDDRSERIREQVNGTFSTLIG